MTTRLLATDALAVPLETGGADPLSTASAVLADSPVPVGLWEAGPGTDTDVEVDELFVVLAGAGTVRFEDGEVIELRPGVVVRLHAGDRTTWVVTERLRKLYVTA